MSEIAHKGPHMFIWGVLLVMAVLPVIWIGGEHFYFHSALPLMVLVGKWFVFWAAGIRLFSAGLVKLVRPQFTTEGIFGIESRDALPFVRELGAGNLAMGFVGIASLAKPSFVLPVAVAAALFYGIAGVRHAADKGRTLNQNIAMISDLFVFLVLVAYVGYVALA